MSEDHGAGEALLLLRQTTLRGEDYGRLEFRAALPVDGGALVKIG